jgi:F-type H+-transporting ATPase subunit b
MEKLISEFSVGLFFWQSLLFIALVFLLRKFAWKPILNAVNQREENIHEALEMAEKTKSEMKMLQAQNENLLKEARVERDSMIKDAKETASKMVDDAKNRAKEEAEKVLTSAQLAIRAEKNAALTELKTQVASMALEIAEKIVRDELSAGDKQKKMASQLAEEISLN